MNLQQANDALSFVSFPGYAMWVSESDRMWLQASFTAPDCKTGLAARQYTRKWYISHEATVSELVQTAFKCVLTSIEHEARESFTYKGQPVFSPHFDVDALAFLCSCPGTFAQRNTEIAA